jgi:hypothetical protein
VHPLLTVQAANRNGLPITLALAILTLESHGGRNEWGRDPNAIFSGGYDSLHDRQWGPRVAGTSPAEHLHYVTAAGYRAYAAQRDRTGKTQGVGPTMLTTAKYQRLADEHGGAWKPYPNMVVGFYVLKTAINSHGGLNSAGILRGLVEYNAGPNPRPTGEADGERYAARVLAIEKEWATRLHRRSVQG